MIECMLWIVLPACVKSQSRVREQSKSVSVVLRDGWMDGMNGIQSVSPVSHDSPIVSD